jgi:AcrR family transcriptional regulator
VPRPVKSGPTYRQQQASSTKERIADVGRRLFAEHGYGATSMEAIADAAGVAVRTVYAAFGAKREILSLICELWLERAGAREGVGRVLAVADPRERVHAAARWLTTLYAAGFDVVLVFEAATDESRETRALLRSKLAGRNEAMDTMIASLEAQLTVPVAEAQAVFRALAAPGVYRELVADGAWSDDRFARWVSHVLEDHLLAPEPPSSP